MEDAFERSGALRVKARGPCEVCQKRVAMDPTPREIWHWLTTEALAKLHIIGVWLEGSV